MRKVACVAVLVLAGGLAGCKTTSRPTELSSDGRIAMAVAGAAVIGAAAAVSDQRTGNNLFGLGLEAMGDAAVGRTYPVRHPLSRYPRYAPPASAAASPGYGKEAAAYAEAQEASALAPPEETHPDIALQPDTSGPFFPGKTITPDDSLIYGKKRQQLHPLSMLVLVPALGPLWFTDAAADGARGTSQFLHRAWQEQRDPRDYMATEAARPNVPVDESGTTRRHGSRYCSNCPGIVD